MLADTRPFLWSMKTNAATDGVERLRREADLLLNGYNATEVGVAMRGCVRVWVCVVVRGNMVSTGMDRACKIRQEGGRHEDEDRAAES